MNFPALVNESPGEMTPQEAGDTSEANDLHSSKPGKSSDKNGVLASLGETIASETSQAMLSSGSL